MNTGCEVNCGNTSKIREVLTSASTHLVEYVKDMLQKLKVPHVWESELARLRSIVTYLQVEWVDIEDHQHLLQFSQDPHWDSQDKKDSQQIIVTLLLWNHDAQTHMKLLEILKELLLYRMWEIENNRKSMEQIRQGYNKK